MSADSPYVRRLASSSTTDRMKAIKSLKKWLIQHTDISEKSMRKVWAGLYYCLWMQDKPKDQADMIERLTGFVPTLPNRWEYISMCWETLAREWNTIDRHRIDKFLSLVRIMLRQSLICARGDDKQWNDVELWSESIKSTILNPGAEDTGAVGLKLHILDIVVEELKELEPGQDEAYSVAGLTLLSPFLDVLRWWKDRTMKALTVTHVVNKMIPDVQTKMLANVLYEMASSEDTPDANRQRLFSLFRELKVPVEQSARKAKRKSVEAEEVPRKKKRRSSEKVEEKKEKKLQKKKRRRSSEVKVVDDSDRVIIAASPAYHRVRTPKPPRTVQWKMHNEVRAFRRKSPSVSVKGSPRYPPLYYTHSTTSVQMRMPRATRPIRRSMY